MIETRYRDLDLLHPDFRPVTDRFLARLVEAKIMIPLKDFPLDIMGTWDIETKRDIWDFKFKGKTPNQKDADANTGFTVYSMAKKVKDGMAPKSIHMAGIVKLKTPKTFDITTKRDDHDFHKLLLTVNKIQKSIDAGIFLPASPLSWKCSENWCSYFNICKERLKR